MLYLLEEKNSERLIYYGRSETVKPRYIVNNILTIVVDIIIWYHFWYYYGKHVIQYYNKAATVNITKRCNATIKWFYNGEIVNYSVVPRSRRKACRYDKAKQAETI